MEQHDFIKGALIGGCLGGALALFLAPQMGRKLYDEVTDGYNYLTGQAQDYTDDIKEQANSFLDSWTCDESCNALMLGSVGGAVIGALAALLLAPESGRQLRKRLGSEYEAICEKAKDVMSDVNKTGENIEQKLEDWKDIFSTIADKLSISKRKSSGRSPREVVDDIWDWANLGLNLYNKVHARR
jgi:gas vesicle protein